MTRTALVSGGSSWVVSTFPEIEYAQLNAVTCTGSSDCFAVGGTYAGEPAVIFASTDGGSSFSEETIPSNLQDLTSITCRTTSSCVAVGSESKPFLGGSAVVDGSAVG